MLNKLLIIYAGEKPVHVVFADESAIIKQRVDLEASVALNIFEFGIPLEGTKVISNPVIFPGTYVLINLFEDFNTKTILELKFFLIDTYNYEGYVTILKKPKRDA